MRICYSHRRLFAQLAKELVKQGDNARAQKVLAYAEQAIPRIMYLKYTKVVRMR